MTRRTTSPRSLAWACLCASTLAVALAAGPAAAQEEVSLETLAGLLQDASGEVRAQALRTVARLPKEQAAPLVLGALEKESDVEVLAVCVALAGELREEKAVPILLKIFQRKLRDEGLTVGIGGDLDEKIRQVEEAVRKAKKPEDQKKAGEDLKDLQKAKEERRVVQLRMQVVYLLAIEALGKIGAKEATGKLLDFVTEKSPAVRCAALGALGNLRDPGVRPALEKLLGSSNAHERLCALRGLEAIVAVARPGLDDPWVNKAIACMVVADMENSDRTIAANALQWAMDLGAGDPSPIAALPRLVAYRDLLRANDMDSKHLVDFELLSLYLKHKVVQRALRPQAPAPAPAVGGTIETK